MNKLTILIVAILIVAVAAVALAVFGVGQETVEASIHWCPRCPDPGKK